MADIQIKIYGVEEVGAALESLPPKIKGKVMMSALRAGAGIVRNAYKKRIPERHATGSSQDAKRVSRGKAVYRMPGFAKRSVIVQRKPGATGDWVETGASRRAFYLRILELGSRYHAPRGWLRAAWKETQAAALAKISGQLLVELEKLASRAEQTGKLR